LLAEGTAVPNSRPQDACAKLLKRTDAHRTFLVEGVQPTNNTAERTRAPRRDPL
jgi:hypothetical protein